MLRLASFIRLSVMGSTGFGLFFVLMLSTSAFAQERFEISCQVASDESFVLMSEQGQAESMLVHFLKDGRSKILYKGVIDIFMATEKKPLPSWLTSKIIFKNRVGSSQSMVISLNGVPFLLTKKDEFYALPPEFHEPLLGQTRTKFPTLEIRHTVSGKETKKETYDMMLQDVDMQYVLVDVASKKAAFREIRMDQNKDNNSLQRIFQRPTVRKDSARIMHGAGNEMELPLLDMAVSIQAANLSQISQAKPFTVNQELMQVAQSQIETSLANYEASLRSTILGQDEVIAGLVNLRRQELYFGSDKQSSLIALLGMPGTGKDTTAEADIDALNQKVGASEEHLFRVPIIRDDQDLQKLTGSSVGYLGSDELPPIVRFVVKHSGGEYRIVEKDEPKKGENKYHIELNPEWTPGTVLPGYISPSNSGVFINELHDWNRTGLNLFFKEFAEKGYVHIGNPGEGVSTVTYRGRIYLASNDLIQLYSSMDAKGQRFGAPLTYDQMLNMWNGVHTDKDRLFDGLASAETTGTGSVKELRYSPEVISRMKANSNTVFLMKPLSPLDIQKVINLKLQGLFARIKNAPRLIKGLEANVNRVVFEWPAHLLKYLQEYDYVAEDMARPARDKISKLVAAPLSDFFQKNLAKLDLKTDKIIVDIQENADKSANLIVTEVNTQSQTTIAQVPVIIPATLSKVPVPPMSVERLREFTNIRNEFDQHVVGASEVKDRVASALMNIEDKRNNADDGSAQVFGFLGLTSTGKSEMAKAIGRAYLKNEDGVFTTQFVNVKSAEQFEAAKADMKKAYDRGVRTFFWDEIINTNPAFLYDLLPMLREKKVQFPGGEMDMKGVLIIIGANIGTELYAQIPTDIPVYQKIDAYHKVYEAVVNNPGLIQKTLRGRLPDPLIARLGTNVFFFEPHTFKSIRELTQLKIKKAIENLKAKPGSWGWNVQFASATDLQNCIEALEDEAFIVEQQGASIDKYITEGFEDRLRTQLRSNEVAIGSTVTIHYSGNAVVERSVRKYSVSNLTLDTVKGPLNFVTQGKIYETQTKHRDSDELLTAYHEAAHELVRKILLGDRKKSVRISTIPGVAQLNGDDDFTYYLGIASWEEVEYTPQQRDVVIAQMAVSLAGEVAQTLVTRGAKHDAGKASDVEKASRLAQVAILKWGLSEKWGRSAIPHGMKVSDYLATLTEKRKDLLDREVQALFTEARGLARQVLLLNFDNALVPMSTELAEKRDMKEADLDQFYATHKILMLKDDGVITKIKNVSLSSLSARFSKYFSSSDPISAQLLPTIPVPKMKTAQDFVNTEKAKQVAQVPLPALPIAATQGAAALRCSEVLLK